MVWHIFYFFNLTSNPPLNRTKFMDPPCFSYSAMGSKILKKIQAYPVFDSGIACFFRIPVFPAVREIFYVKCWVFSNFGNLGGSLASLFGKKRTLRKKLILPKVFLTTPQCKSERKSFSGYDWLSDSQSSEGLIWSVSHPA